MTHDGAVFLIPDFVMGCLSRAEDREMRRHVGSCEECRSLSDTYQVISRAYRDDSGEGESGHPTTEELVDFAVDDTQFDGDERNRLTSHLKHCPACKMDFEAVREAETELAAQPIPQLGEPAPVPTPARWLRPAAIAAGVLLVLLAYPAFVGLVEITGGRPAPTPQSEVVKITLLQSPLRSAESTAPVVQIGEAPSIVLAVEPSPLIDLADNTVVHFDLGTVEGAKILSTHMTVSEIRRQISDSGVVGFLVSTTLLEDGPHTMRVAAESDGDLQPLFEAPFEVVRSL